MSMAYRLPGMVPNGSPGDQEWSADGPRRCLRLVRPPLAPLPAPRSPPARQFPPHRRRFGGCAGGRLGHNRGNAETAERPPFMNTGDHARRHARAEVSFDASLTAGGKTGECRIQNISAGGAQVATRMPLSRGDQVVLRIGVMGEADGTVAWVGRGSVGIRFAHDIDTIGDLLMAVAIY